MRCTICDRSDVKLSLYHIEEDIRPVTFYEDPTGKGFICSECAEEYIDQMHEYYLEDDNA